MLIPSMFANKCSPSAGGAEAMAATNAALLAFYFCWEGGPHTHIHQLVAIPVLYVLILPQNVA